MPEKSTLITTKISLKEILESLNIKGEIISCGFNPKEKPKSMKDKTLIIKITIHEPKNKKSNR